MIGFKDARGEYRWHACSPNGRIVASSAGDGYKRRTDCARMALAVTGRAITEWGGVVKVKR